jgi:ubiquinone/menaquinone biosynthesis C-methylase UbiE
MLDLDEALFTDLIKDVAFTGKTVADIGCGTGRHWRKLYTKHPAKLIGLDVSEGMLKVLKEKYSQAETYNLEANQAIPLPTNSCDIIVSTLALAHIENIEVAFTEWGRILKPGGEIFITDYHPDALEKGGNRTFMYNDKTVSIKNYIHPISAIKALAEKLNLSIFGIEEKKIDETIKHYYDEQNAGNVFERFKGTNIIYAAHLIKRNAAT